MKYYRFLNMNLVKIAMALCGEVLDPVVAEGIVINYVGQHGGGD